MTGIWQHGYLLAMSLAAEQIMVKDRCGGKLCWSFFLPEKEKPAAYSCRLCHHTAALRTALICFCHLFRFQSTPVFAGARLLRPHSLCYE